MVQPKNDLFGHVTINNRVTVYTPEFWNKYGDYDGKPTIIIEAFDRYHNDLVRTLDE